MAADAPRVHGRVLGLDGQGSRGKGEHGQGQERTDNGALESLHGDLHGGMRDWAEGCPFAGRDHVFRTSPSKATGAPQMFPHPPIAQAIVMGQFVRNRKISLNPEIRPSDSDRTPFDHLLSNDRDR